MSIPELEAAINSLRHQLVFWTIIVALGLVIEYVKDIKEFLVDTFRWLARGGARPHLTKIVIGGLLITAGVTMEGWIEFRSSDIETRLAKNNDDSLTDARLRTTLLERENLALRAAIADRELTPKQQQMIGAALKGFSRRGTRQLDDRVVTREVWTESAPSGEAQRLCRQIYSALKGNVPVRDLCGERILTNVPDGFSIRPGAVLLGNSDVDFSSALVNALMSIGKLEPAKEPIEAPPDGFDTEMLVGHKPPIDLGALPK